MSLREPVLHPTPILSLRPTQITLGMKEVYHKRDAWKKKTEQDLSKFLSAHMVPVITGLEGQHYLIDHHHLARALHEEGLESVFVNVVADLSRLPADHFWNMMSFHGWTPARLVRPARLRSGRSRNRDAKWERQEQQGG